MSGVSTGLLVILTVAEIVLLVAVLVLYLVLLTRRLQAVDQALVKVSEAVRFAQGDVALVGAGAAILNRKLDAIAAALPPIAAKAESLARGK